MNTTENLENQESNLPEKPKRRGGAPTGNHNAFKHGFYAQDFNRQRKDQPEQGIIEKLEEEEKLLSVLIQRVYDCMLQEEMDIERQLSGLRAINLAIRRKNAIHREREKINDQFTGIWEAMQEIMGIQPDEE